VKIFEIAVSDNNPEANLLTALELLRNRYKDKNVLPKVSTDSLIQLVLNTNRTFDYEALKAAVENNPAVKTLIKSYNRKYVILNPLGDLADTGSTTSVTPQGDTESGNLDTVGDMARRAAKERGAAF